jgi:hypothetical protein
MRGEGAMGKHVHMHSTSEEYVWDNLEGYLDYLSYLLMYIGTYVPS